MIWQGKQSLAFFEINLPEHEEIIAPSDVISLTITEELERMPKGSLTLRDPNLLYSRLIPRGAQIEVAWGYISDPSELGFEGESIEAFNRGTERRGFRAWVQNPTGSADEAGQAQYNLNFLSMDFRGEHDVTEWAEDTKADVVRGVFEKLGITRRNQHVRFDRGSERVTEDNPVRQAETDFQFLARLAREWGAVLDVGHDADTGDPLGVFLESRFMSSSFIVAKMAGREPGARDFEYKVGRNPNVISYNWRHHEGESGVGDATSIEYVNGEAQFVRRTVEQDSVTTWRLNEQRVQEEFERRNDEGGRRAELAFVQEILQAREFEEVQRFFDEVEAETAPNGVGYSIDCKVYGDTTLAPGTEVRFGAGFPDMFLGEDVDARTLTGRPRSRKGDRPIGFYVRKNQHTINNDGYFSDIEVVDAYALSPTGVTMFGGGPL